MPSFSRHLEESLHRAVAYANQRKHEYATLEHLLLALIDDEDAAGVMRACDVDLGSLKKNLINYLDTELRSLIVDDGDDAKPTAGFQRVIQRAVIHVQSSGRDEVTGANVLVAVFSERETAWFGELPRPPTGLTQAMAGGRQRRSPVLAHGWSLAQRDGRQSGFRGQVLRQQHHRIGRAGRVPDAALEEEAQ